MDTKEENVERVARENVGPVCALVRGRRSAKIVQLDELVSSIRTSDVATFGGPPPALKTCRKDALKFFIDADRAGLAVYRRGRRGHPTRLEWKMDPTRFFQLACAVGNDIKRAYDEPSADTVPTGDDAMTDASGTSPATNGAPFLTHGELATDVREVFRRASKGKGTRPQWLTAYQVLERLPQRDRLIAERGMPGEGAGVHHAAASVVRDSIRLHLKSEVEVTFLDTRGIRFEIAGVAVAAGFPVVALYRMAEDASAEV
jgi:hypothetical protein